MNSIKNEAMKLVFIAVTAVLFIAGLGSTVMAQEDIGFNTAKQLEGEWVRKTAAIP